jgi:hypothetical protein
MPLYPGTTASTALALLRWHWGDAYDISVDGDEWQAVRKDGEGSMISAPVPDELRMAMLADYSLKPVSRDMR